MTQPASWLLLLMLGLPATVPALGLGAQPMTDEEAEELGRRIWHNETGGRMDRLLWWNRGEEFASLGIGHFIWYPRHYDGPFRETFPALVEHLRAGGTALPSWLDKSPPPPCPWSTREAFLAATGDARRLDLQALLEGTLAAQSRFLVQRLQQALPLLLAAVPGEQRATIRRRLESLLATPAGRYALVDYVNFKGEGLSPTERYQGQGWGLLQVLGAMTGAPSTPAADFAAAADRVLTRRVANADPSRHEERWLPGWRRRLATYAAGHE
ncbi:MAG: hypothetical protein U5S82_04260 [Gammaproteobacteria bacterium]|nr:hypothetical protein [Gammaproteobacteria bacterium]